MLKIFDSDYKKKDIPLFDLVQDRSSIFLSDINLIENHLEYVTNQVSKYNRIPNSLEKVLNFPNLTKKLDLMIKLIYRIIPAYDYSNENLGPIETSGYFWIMENGGQDGSKIVVECMIAIIAVLIIYAVSETDQITEVKILSRLLSKFTSS